MLFNILVNDLRRKKSINFLLFLFIIISSMLMAGSGTVLYSTSNAISRMIKEANVPDLMIFAYDNEQSCQEISGWAEESEYVKSIDKDKSLLIMSDSVLKDGEVIVDEEDIGSSFFTAVPKKHSMVFKQDDQPLSLESGELAIPMFIHNKYDINIGDQIELKIDGYSKEFVVTSITKDIVFGSDMMSRRYVLSDQDFKEIWNSESKEIVLLNIWSVATNEGATFPEVAGEFGSKSINVLSIFGVNDIDTFYLVSKMVSMIMIVVSVSLILIAFLILRFTIIFTIQEDFRAIGIMKGLGIRSRSIRGIYLVKYFTISVIGGLVGFFLSFIYSRVMLGSLSETFLTSTNQAGIFIAILGSLSVIIMSILFCTFCTRKINSVSVVEAIRHGHSGERFTKSQKVRLFKKRRLLPSDYLSISDLVNGFKKFAILTITFILGTLLMIVPLNIISTLKAEDSMMSIMGLPPFDVSVMSDEAMYSVFSQDYEGLDRELLRIETLFDEEGYPIDIHAELGKKASAYTDNPDQSLTVDVMQGRNYDTENYVFLSGSAPMLENEIAVSSKIAKYFGLKVGDSITTKLADMRNSFLVTAIYPSLSSSGSSVRVSNAFKMPPGNESFISLYGTYTDEQVDTEQALNDMKNQYPEISLSTKTDLYNRYIGGSIRVVDSMKNLIVGVVLGIVFLITCLIVRILISREIPEIALLKSIGFQKNHLIRWQIGRIALVLFFSILVGTSIAGPVSGFILNIVFNMLGVPEVMPVIDPIQVYLIYPLILLASTTLAAAISIGQIKKTQVWEINNQE